MRIEANLDVRREAGTFRANWTSGNALYWVTPVGADATGDSLRHRIGVIEDVKPSIRVTEDVDSTARKRLFHWRCSRRLWLQQTQLCVVFCRARCEA